MKKFFILTFFIFLSVNSHAFEIKDFNRNAKNYNLKLQIFDDKKNIATFFVALADTQEKRQYGLMNLAKLPINNGMLFIFEKSEIINMWMKNTLIPLDMIFIDELGYIVNIGANATPLSLDVISSRKIAKKVLEINGGLTKKFGIKIGQKIVYENF